MAGQDIKKRLLPGQSQPINVGGDFIFLKFADRPVNILINGGQDSGSRVTMEPGDKYRPGAFESFEVENTDRDRPAQIILTVGRGDYNRQIVKGELTVAPGIQQSDGKWKADQRQTVSGYMVPQYPKDGGSPVNSGDIVASNRDNEMYVPGVGQREIEKVLGAWEENNQFCQLLLVDSTPGEALFIRRTDRNLTTLNDEFVVRLQGRNGYWRAGTRINGEILLFVQDGPGDGGQSHIAKVNYTNETEKPLEIVKSFDPAIYEWLIRAVTQKDGKLVVTVPAHVAGNGEWIWFIDPVTLEIEAKIRETEMADGGAWTEEPWCFHFDPVNKQWSMSASDAGHYWLYNEDFSAVEKYQDFFENASSGTSTKPNLLKFGNFIYGNFMEGYYSNHATINKYLLEADQRPFSGKIWANGCYSPLVSRNVNGRATLANITITEKDGLTTIEGELIRVILDWYMGAVIKDGTEYMDHVYSVKITGQNGEIMQTQTAANGATLAALGIRDNFKATFPAQIEMTVDNNIETITQLGV